MNCDNYNQFMQNAIDEAKKARSIGEVPVGAVIVFENKIIGSGYNKRETSKNALSHAEIEAINEACKTLGSWRLLNCDLYVTLEPCPMCASAIVQSRISKVYIGTFNKDMGCCGSVINLADDRRLGTFLNVRWSYDERCSDLLNNFFKLRRQE